MMRRPLVDAFQVVLEDLDAAIEQRSDSQQPFLLCIDKVLGRPPREQPKDLVRNHIPPIPHLIGEPGVLFSRFFGHMRSSVTNCTRKRDRSLFASKRVSTCNIFDAKSDL